MMPKKNRTHKIDINSDSCASNPTYINPTLNPTSFRYLFQINGLVTIPNFLEPKFAEKYYDFLTQEMGEEWWYLSSFSSQEKLILQNSPGNIDKIQEAIKLANQEFKSNNFSYAFYRTYNNHFPECNCLECQFRQKVQSTEFINFLNQITGLGLEKNNELFVSRYGANCFLTVHNDQGNGRIAFVLNMTKNWKPQFGGNFHLLTKDRENIRKVISPRFNSLTIFRIPDPAGIPHYVSHVVPVVTGYRYAISGWFS